MKLLLMMYTQDFHFLHFSGFSAEVHETETRLTSQVSASALHFSVKKSSIKKRYEVEVVLFTFISKGGKTTKSSTLQLQVRTKFITIIDPDAKQRIPIH